MSGNKSRTTRKAKKPAAGRMAQFNACIRKGSANKENIPSISTPPSGTSLPKKSLPGKKDYKLEYQNTQHKLRHAKTCISKFQNAVTQYKAREAERQCSAALAMRQVAELNSTIKHLLSEGQMKASETKLASDLLRKKIKALQQQVKRRAGMISRSIARAKKSQVGRVTERGIYTVHARKMARIMADAGCTRGKVGSLMEKVGEIFGVRINRCMSRRTVSRTIQEGGIAAQMQATFELGLNEGSSRSLSVFLALMRLQESRSVRTVPQIRASTLRARTLPFACPITHRGALPWTHSQRLEFAFLASRRPLTTRVQSRSKDGKHTSKRVSDSSMQVC